MNEPEEISKQHSTMLKSDETEMHQVSSVTRLNNVTKQKSILNQQGTDICLAQTEDSIDAQERLKSFEESDIKNHHKQRRQHMKRKIHLPHLDNDDSPTALKVQNEIIEAPVVKRSPIASKLLCSNDTVKDTKNDQTHFSNLGSRDGESVPSGYSTEETLIYDTDIEEDGSGDDCTQQTSENQTVRHSSTTTTQTPPEETTYLQNRRHDVFPDPDIDDFDLQRFEPMKAIIDKIAVGERVAPQITMRYEMLRLCTLRSFPKENKPYIIRIAQAGFYYANSRDEVVCYCCAKRKSCWRETDVPIVVHRQLSPNCRFLISNSEVNVSVRRQDLLATRRPASAAADAKVTKSKTIQNITTVTAPSPLSSRLTTTVNTMYLTPARYSSQGSEIFLDDLRAVGKRCADLDLKKFKASVAGISLDAQDLDSLKNNGWLTDKIIDAYLMFLQRRCEDKQLHVFVLQTFVGSSWNEGHFGLHLYEQAKLTDCKWVFVPMHVNGNHWVLLVAHMPTKTVTVYDSLHKDNMKCFNLWKKFMSERARHVSHDSPEGWTLGRNLSSSQRDSDSCGAFVLLNALATVNDIATEELNHDHAIAMRTYVLWTLIDASNVLREE